MNEGHDPKQQRTVPYVVRIVEDQWTTWRHVIEAIAIVAAGLWAFYTFVYQENIKPASEPAALTPKIIVSRLGRDATRDLLNVTLQFRNSGKTEIDIAADAIDVYGVRYGTKPVAKTQSLGKKFVSFSRQLPVISRTVVLRQYELRALAKGGMAGYHIVLEPGATADLPMDL
ncbi:MAG: hypothetical protein KGN02_14240, partial [bacterium]|nr:hypothetical protein [bacterium]